MPTVNAWVITGFACFAFWLVWKLKRAVDADRASFRAEHEAFRRRWDALIPAMRPPGPPDTEIHQQVSPVTLFGYQAPPSAEGGTIVDAVWVMQQPGEQPRLEVFQASRQTQVSIRVGPEDLRRIGRGFLSAALRAENGDPSNPAAVVRHEDSAADEICPRCGSRIGAHEGTELEGRVVCWMCGHPQDYPEHNALIDRLRAYPTAWARVIKDDE
jgi:hypothetical protein